MSHTLYTPEIVHTAFSFLKYICLFTQCYLHHFVTFENLYWYVFDFVVKYHIEMIFTRYYRQSFMCTYIYILIKKCVSLKHDHQFYLGSHLSFLSKIYLCFYICDTYTQNFFNRIHTHLTIPHLHSSKTN